MKSCIWSTSLCGGIPVNDDTLALDLIDKIGPGGHYLEEDHTLDNFKNVWYSDLFDRAFNAEWLAKGAKRFEERLREKTEEVMLHQPVPLSNEVINEMEQMMRHWE
jgi:trimethylamine--corrinoid protein Co-methyltransferase